MHNRLQVYPLQNQPSGRRLRRGLLALFFALALGLFFGSTTFAQEPAPDDGAKDAPAAVENHAITTADDNRREVGVWYVVDYPPAGNGGSDLPATRPDALGLRNKLTSTCRLRLPFFGCISNWPTPSWISRFAYGNASAWEQDWKRSAAGGTENIYVDSVDLAYFAGHGWTGGIIFGAGGNQRDDANLTFQDAFRTWGDRDLDWIGFAACNVLDDPNLGNWANTMDGLRVMMGFKTVMSDVPHGEWFGEYIRMNYTMPQAWFAAADRLQPQGVIARVIAEERWMYNDRWHAHDNQDYYDSTYWYWTHSVGSEPARFVDNRQVSEMPIFEVAPLALSEVNSRWDTLGSATGVTTTDFITQTRLVSLDGRSVAQTSDPLRFSEDGKLLLDEGSGLFSYTNTDTLWTVPDQEEESRAVVEISATDAMTIAEQFLANNGLLPSDAQFFEVLPDTLTQAALPADGRMGSGTGAILQEQTTANQVIYSRILTYTTNSNGRAPAQTVEFSVMGPGSKLKVQVAPTVRAGLSRSALQSEAVVGGVGGYRAVQQPVVKGTNIPQTVPILAYDKIAKLVELNAQNQPELESMFGLSYIPLGNIETRTILSNTLAYWEGSVGFNQSQLIPVHVIDVRNVLDDSTVVTSTAYLPANARYMAPLAQIESVVPGDGGTLPAQLTVGMTLTLTAADANQTLAAAGYDSALDFVPGSGDYLYEWYVDSVAPENLIGSGRSITYQVRQPDGTPKAGESAVGQNILLTVRDVNPVSDAQQSTDSSEISVVPAVFLPAVLGD